MSCNRVEGWKVRAFEWTYDDSNNRQSVLDVDSNRAVKWEYEFDWVDRLVTVKRDEAPTVGGLTTATLQREYVFDESDNRTFFDDHVHDVTYYYKYKSIDDNGTTRWSASDCATKSKSKKFSSTTPPPAIEPSETSYPSKPLSTTQTAI